MFNNPVRHSSMVSVIIPCYNHANFVSEAIESVVQQTYQNWECFIVNNGSCDNTSDVVKKMINLHKCKQITLIETPNSGVIDARNKGLEYSSGEYILFVDADDKIDPNFLQETVKTITEKPEVGFVYTDIQYFGVRHELISYGDFEPRLFLRNNQACVTSLFRRKVYEQVGGMKKVMEEGLEDWEFWIAAYEKGWQGYRLAKPYVYYRQHPAGSRLQNLVSCRSKLELQKAIIIKLHAKLYTWEEIIRSEQILRENRSLLAKDSADSLILPNSEQFLSGLSSNAEQYQIDPNNQLALAHLRQARNQIAEKWLSLSVEQITSMYISDLGKAHQILLNSNIQDEPLTEDERNFVSLLSVKISEKIEPKNAFNYLLIAMLYRRAYHLTLPYNLHSIPNWFVKEYLNFIFYSPSNFHECGEVENYYYHISTWINYIHKSIYSDHTSSFYQNVASIFVMVCNLIPLYFHRDNIKNIYSKRADILEFFLKLNGCQIDYNFPDRNRQKKFRLGILAAHFQPAAETFASLPVYEYISREFEVILYSLVSTAHPLEEYCKSCANSFKLLPENLIDQVNFIRFDDLDIIFIATNVTAVTNQICLLSLHRLARVQVTSVSSVVTTGIRNIDFYISGKLTDSSKDAEQHYQEKLLKLEGSAHCFSYGSEENVATVKVDRKSLNISSETTVFISVANLFKIIPDLRIAWAKLISLVPNSVLILLPFGPNWSSYYPKSSFLKDINTTFTTYGLAEDRLLILDPSPVPNREDIKEYLKLADVYLDSYPFSGTTSLIEPLEVGLPVVTKEGSNFRSSMGAALLRDLGITDLIANSEDSYLKLAFALGTNPELRQQKSAQIQQRMQASPRFLDSRSYSAQMGTLFQELFWKHQEIAITDKLKLRDINIIIFPDWSQPEDLLYQELASVITCLVNHPDKNQMTLLINTDNVSEDDANLFLSEVVMNLLLEEDLDVAAGPEISLVGQLGERQWEALLPHIQARIILENENQQAMPRARTSSYAQVKLETIPSCELDSFISQGFSIRQNP